MTGQRDHGGGLDAAIAQFGGRRGNWIDLSTGINPNPYPMPSLPAEAWSALPDHHAISDLESAARRFWKVPDEMEVVVAGGASALIAAMPRVLDGNICSIPSPTYNEHLAAFEANGWRAGDAPDATVLVHPNNPDGRFWDELPDDIPGQLIIDESFCDVAPDRSFLGHYSTSGVELANASKSKPYGEKTRLSFDTNSPIILKSFGKFWGLAGLRLGFAICGSDIAKKLRDQIGPWAVSGPACHIGALALADISWAQTTRQNLQASAKRLDTLLKSAGLSRQGGTDLFRLVEVKDAQAMQTHLARHQILTRIFPYSKTWVRFGLPGPQDHWTRLEAALKSFP